MTLREQINAILIRYGDVLDERCVKDGIAPEGWQLTQFTDSLDAFFQAENALATLLTTHAEEEVHTSLVELMSWSFSELDEANKDGLEVSNLYRDKIQAMLAAHKQEKGEND